MNEPLLSPMESISATSLRVLKASESRQFARNI